MTEDDPLRDAHIAIGKAIAELKAIGVTVPVTLHLAMHALTYARAERDGCRGWYALGRWRGAEDKEKPPT
jgi:hypothetical protein